MEPTTTLVINHAAPTSSPIANPPLFDLNALLKKYYCLVCVIYLNVENKSLLPLPNANNVTPAYKIYLYIINSYNAF